MSKKTLFLVVVMAMLALAAFGCGQQQAEQPADNNTGTEEQQFDGEILVGIMVPTTGSEATYGKDMENAINIAADQINAKGGVMGKKIVTVTADDACDPQQSASAANKLISQGVVAVVGGYCSGATIPTLTLYNDAKIPFVITAANSSKIETENPGNAFETNGTAKHQVEKAIEMWTNGGVKKVAIVHQGDAYSEDLAKMADTEWKAAGNEVVAMEVMNKGEQDTSALVTRIKAKNPDLVFWTAYFADGGLLIKQLRQSGYTGKIMVGDGSCSPQLIEIGGTATEGVQVLSSPIADYLPAAKQYVEDYKAKYSMDPGPYSALAFDGLGILADAMTRANATDFDAVVKALSETKDYQGIAGTTTFAENHTLATSNFMVVEVKDGKFVLVQ
ncbi:branched-chain amino acid ABC transporter substrate-binding protein [Candidatus Formimonas warabiya]|uniref:Branched chain amino acid ABC transporter substrate-binding protein n=1 Tax=Formimonas warabiya TaxID=1761012 RepID=A0A3G1KU02_FORW1|nr:branched-chain amino acid ABC transporter substrate-binding protein [Candidatus Formimonas warabiya]ATW25926.1 branched chain amino acid ABC transporter substrate-binding protein [Candidatus Formimonas warabiya]